jgi:hypothetical protein
MARARAEDGGRVGDRVVERRRRGVREEECEGREVNRRKSSVKERKK